ncbi:unnamed protein product [Brassica rapa subsp. narinosa]
MGVRSSKAVDPVLSRRYSSESEATLVVRRRPHMVNGGGFVGGMVQALNMVHKKWEGFGYDKEGTEKLLFTLKDPKESCLVQHGLIRILVHGKPKISTCNIYNNNYVQIRGSFAERDCNIMDSDGRNIAQVRIEKEMEEMVGNKKDLYNIIVKANVDQAFIVGVIAVLDYIHGESTIC